MRFMPFTYQHFKRRKSAQITACGLDVEAVDWSYHTEEVTCTTCQLVAYKDFGRRRMRKRRRDKFALYADK